MTSQRYKNRAWYDEMFQDEYFIKLNHFEKILWIGLLFVVADTQGRFELDVAKIRYRLFVYDGKVSNRDVEKAIQKFSKAKRILIYKYGDGKLVQFINWWKYQGVQRWGYGSHFPAPEGWHDPVCYQGKGNAEVRNKVWENMKKAHAKHVLSTWSPRAPLTMTNDSDHDSDHDSEIKDQPTNPTLPPKVVGGLVGPDFISSAQFKKLTGKSRTEIKKIAHVMSLAGLGKAKLETLLSQMATRRKPNNKLQLVMAALASAYDDKSVNNKPVVALSRIDRDIIDARYFSPDTWHILPEEILSAAGKVVVNGGPRGANTKQTALLKKLRGRGKS